MKRVMGGKAYNTHTAETIARAEYTYEKAGREWCSDTTLYRTPKGAWFLVETEHPQEDHQDHIEVRNTLMPLDNLDKAFAWVKQNQCELIKSEYFPTICKTDAPARRGQQKKEQG